MLSCSQASFSQRDDIAQPLLGEPVKVAFKASEECRVLRFLGKDFASPIAQTPLLRVEPGVRGVHGRLPSKALRPGECDARAAARFRNAGKDPLGDFVGDVVHPCVDAQRSCRAPRGVEIK